MKISRKFAMAAVAIAASTAGLLTSASQAGAATTGASYNGECGPGYSQVNSAPIGSQGTVFLTYNASNGQNCVVTKRNSAAATPEYMFSYLYVPDTEEGALDEGEYYSYAGPVYAYGKGMCVDWAGGITNQATWTYDSNCDSLTEHRVTKGW